MESCVENDSKCKKEKPGIVYLSRIPRRMNVKQIRHVFGSFGEVGRVFLKPIGSKSAESRKNRTFTEGWVEFADKHIARHVASSLNNTQVGGKRRSPWYSDLWNIKYLPRFTWGLLNERLAYERAVHKSRLRTEVAIVKRETEHFAHSVKQAKRDKKVKSRTEKDGVMKTTTNGAELPGLTADVMSSDYSSQSTKGMSSVASSSETLSSNSKMPKDKPTNSDFLRRIFSGGFSNSHLSDGN